MTLDIFELVCAKTRVNSLAQVSQELNGACANTDNFVANRVSYNTYSCHERFCLFKLVLIKDLIFDLLDSSFA